MSSITYRLLDGSDRTIASDGTASVMQAAVRNGVPGILAECGGQAMCATCHVYVAPEHVQALPAITEEEEEMLECTAAERRDNSRLSCQLPTTKNLTVQIPETQV
ncbi:(2Fe-2S)-binding protein [Arthrobacter sp. Marseille-P9274]|uniref:2Fe-2S iron-sulfur cluster-binding protein n=1 Tax=Arthrobacter sp. Marseille-P9274 TaxID=2866572 RepID=UPI0021CA42AB|nr:(2Fe-2S)-binding protein [Arthrobacter sp. Marseille-P9274]